MKLQPASSDDQFMAAQDEYGVDCSRPDIGERAPAHLGLCPHFNLERRATACDIELKEDELRGQAQENVKRLKIAESSWPRQASRSG